MYTTAAERRYHCCLALESLITSLRTHLARLTSELSSHKELLTELRSLRDSDARMLKQKTAEIERLKEEVERLAGEVEVLRGVVEEGLKQRRAVRDVSMVQLTADVAMSEDLEPESDEHEGDFEADHSGIHAAAEEAEQAYEGGDDEIEDDEPELFDPHSIHGSKRADRTMRTDHATFGSSNMGASTTGGGRIITSEELECISTEVEERRQAQQIHPPSVSSIQVTRRRTATIEDVVDQEASRDARRPQSPHPSNAKPSPPFARGVQDAPQTSTSNLPVPSPTQASGYNGRHLKAPVIETPFPQIRGAHLERLFFSAPEHNAKACTMCHRHRRRSEISSSWIPYRLRRMAEDTTDDGGEGTEDDEDEGFAEGPEEPEHQGVGVQNPNGKQREHATPREPGPWRQDTQTERLPPQTVVARVIRELEDDFTHYKRLVP